MRSRNFSELYIYIYLFNWTSYVLVAIKYTSTLSLLYGVYLYSCTPCFILCGKCTEVGKITLKSNTDEAFSDEFLQKNNGDEALNEDSLLSSNSDEALNAE
jgi:hypothetical protein